MQNLRSNKISNKFVPWGNLSSFSPWDMIVPQGKEGLNYSPWQLKLLPKDMIIPWEKPTSLKKRLKFFGETYVLNLLAITIISYLFLYKLVTYYWKGFEENYNFVVGSTSIKTHMKKIMFTQSFKHICSLKEHGCSLKEIPPSIWLAHREKWV